MAAAMGLLARHRQARELLATSHSVGTLPASSSRPPRPQSAGGLYSSRSSNSCSAAALIYGGGSQGGGMTDADSGGLSSSSSTAPVPRVRPRSATAGVRGTGGERPGALAPQRSPHASASASTSRRSPPARSNSPTRRPPSSPGPPLPTVPPERLLHGPPPPLPPLPASEVALPGASEAGDTTDDDFTAEELHLEKEVEQSLKELEVAEAAVHALRIQLENGHEDAATSRRELLQLQGVVADWKQATEDGRRQLDERHRRVEELMAALSPPLYTLGPATVSRSQAEQTARAAQAQASDAPSPKSQRRRLDLIAERVRVLEGQTARLEEQVAQQQTSAQAAVDERKRLEQQAEILEQERDSLRASLREARAGTRELDTQLKQREEAIAEGARRRQVLERQLLHLRGEANGLQARLAAHATAARAVAEASAGDIAGASSKAAEDTMPVGSGAAAQEDVEGARSVSLQLQHEIVNLWEELRQTQEPVSSPRDASHAQHSCGRVAADVSAAAVATTAC